MNPLVFIPQDIESEGKSYLKARDFDLKIGSSLNKNVLIEEAKNCDAILTRSNAMIDKDVIASAKNLKIIAKYGVGLDNIDINAASTHGIYVTNTPEANANVVAEHVMALMLALSKNLFVTDRELRIGHFDIRTELVSVDLEDKTLGLIGLGRIGNLVAQKAHHGFGMNVIGYDPYVENPIKEVHMVNEVDQLLEEADFVSLHLPLLDSTRGIIGEREFNLMKANSYFINASRGGVVVESDLIKILKNNTIAGAAVDVFETEPPETDNKLFELDNVIVTPHNAALSVEGAIRMAVHAAMQIDEFFNGKVPKWAVNGKDIVKHTS